VKTIVTSVLRDKDLGLKYCKKLEADLGLKLPTKAITLSDYLHTEVKEVKLRKPPEERRVGVGYKDKGSLPEGSKEDPLDNDSIWRTEEDLFEVLLKNTEEVLAFSESYDSKKKSKILQEISKSLK
jgi:hypothetical protein